MDNRDTAKATLPESTPEPQNLSPEFDPWQELEDVHRRMEALLHRTFGFDPKGFHRSGLREAVEAEGVRGIEPDIDIFENEREFLLYAALPGINPHEIDLQANEVTLTLTAEIQAPFTGLEDSESYTTHHRRSRRSRNNRFHFAYRLPTDIRPDEIRASFRHGLLELHLPKRQMTVGKKQSIPIDLEGSSVPASGVVTDLSSSYLMQPPPRMREGAPTHKIGPTYVPSTGEDHTSKAQSVGERTENVGSSNKSRS
jgi:HSP20 family molecular chaperone IbpA